MEKIGVIVFRDDPVHARDLAHLTREQERVIARATRALRSESPRLLGLPPFS